MHNERQLIEIDLIFQQGIGVSGPHDKELVHEAFGDFRVFEPVLIRHSFQQCNLLLVMRMELSLVFIEEGPCLREKLFEDHVQVEANEDWE